MSCCPSRTAVEVPLALEPMHAACAMNWTFLTDPRSVVALVEEYASPYLKLAYDTYHFPLGHRQRRQLRSIAPHIGIVHLGDRRVPPSVDQDRCPLGAGRLPLARDRGCSSRRRLCRAVRRQTNRSGNRAPTTIGRCWSNRNRHSPSWFTPPGPHRWHDVHPTAPHQRPNLHPPERIAVLVCPQLRTGRAKR